MEEKKPFPDSPANSFMALVFKEMQVKEIKRAQYHPNAAGRMVKEPE